MDGNVLYYLKHWGIKKFFYKKENAVKYAKEILSREIKGDSIITTGGIDKDKYKVIKYSKLHYDVIETRWGELIVSLYADEVKIKIIEKKGGEEKVVRDWEDAYDIVDDKGFRIATCVFKEDIKKTEYRDGYLRCINDRGKYYLNSIWIVKADVIIEDEENEARR